MRIRLIFVSIALYIAGFLVLFAADSVGGNLPAILAPVLILAGVVGFYLSLGKENKPCS